MTPLVSVVMSVYNGEEYLSMAIDSILTQSYARIEFIIINDGSIDRSGEIITAYDDDRIRYYENNGNKGLIYSLNKGFFLAKGEYIARMDSDDIALPLRIEKQVEYLENNLDVSLVCSNVEYIDGSGNSKGLSDRKKSEKQLEIELLFSNGTIIHPVVMLRKKSLWENMYDENFPIAEDYALWTIFASKKMKMSILSDILLKYRVHANNVTYKNNSVRFRSIRKIIELYLTSLGISVSERELDMQTSFHSKEGMKQFGMTEVDIWLHKLYMCLSDRYRREDITYVFTRKYIYLLVNKLNKSPFSSIGSFFTKSIFLEENMSKRLEILTQIIKMKLIGH